MNRPMNENRPPRSRARAMLATGWLAAALVACNPASPGGPEPPVAGETFVLSYEVFATRIDPILTKHGCDHTACHGGGEGGAFRLSPAADNDVAFDFAQARLQVEPTNPPSSPLAMKPLAEECGGPGHGGGAFFYALDDPDYLAILDWIEAGEFR